MLRRLLLVDDEPEYTRMLCLALQSLGKYAIASVNEPEQVRAAARSFKPDLILLDVMMPGADGGDVAAHLKEDPQLRHVPVIFLTALVADEEFQRNAYSVAEHSILPKSIDLDTLDARIQERLDAEQDLISI